MILKTSLDNEATIKELNYGIENLLLTTDRVRHSKNGWGSKDTTSILLSEVCSVSTHFRSYIFLIILAVLTLIATYFMMESSNASQYMSFGILLMIILVIAFFMTRKQILVISSAGEKIVFETKGMKKDEIVDFIDTIEKAKEDKSKRD